MENFKDHCFVCGKKLTGDACAINREVQLPVCDACKGTPEEKKKAEEYLDSLADGLVCGCI